jgi:hypothetical protein
VCGSTSKLVFRTSELAFVSLQALSSKAALPLSSERNDNATGTQGEEVQEKPLVWQCPKVLSFRVHELTIYRLVCGLFFFWFVVSYIVMI